MDLLAIVEIRDVQRVSMELKHSKLEDVVVEMVGVLI